MNLSKNQYQVLSDAGKRPHNEDFVYPTVLGSDDGITQVDNLYIVCDGIGGLGKGDVAARLTAAHFAKWISENFTQESLNLTNFNQALKHVETAFDEYIKSHPECWGMGATVALLFMNSAGAHIAWAGNCRVYHFRNGEKLYFTEDHTEAAQLLREGKITEKESLTHNRRFPLRAIQGSSYPTQLDTHFIPANEINDGDIFYLCTDGVTEAIRDNEIGTILGHEESLQKLNTEIRDLCMISSSDNFASCLVSIGGEAGSNNAQNKPATSVNTPPLVAAEGNQTSSFSQSENRSGNQPPLITPPPPAQTESSGFLPLLILGLTAVLAVVIGLMWYSGKSKTKSYEQYVQLAKENASLKKYDESLLYLDSANMLAGDNQTKIRDANLLRNEYLEQKRQANKEAIIAEADRYIQFGKYSDLIQARSRYEDVIKNYGDNGAVVQNKLNDLNARMKAIKPEDAYNNLLSEIKTLCGEGKDLDANLYIAEARKLTINSERLQGLTRLEKECPSLAQNATKTGETVADNRSIAEANPSTGGTTNTSSPSTERADAKTTKSSTGGTTTSSGPKSSPQVVENGSNKARVGKPGSSTQANEWEKLSVLEKGKHAFEKGKNDKMYYTKSRQYLEEAQKANTLDGAGAYMLAYMYNAGIGGAKDLNKAWNYASTSDQKNWPAGKYLHAKLYLGKKTKNDSIIAKGKLAEAKTLGSTDATKLLSQLK
ncbi:MAG: protein phosphatase 2C domain-containing protein [Bacteroidia bacterium]|nr:protein phosphatase 2C domain-containing protein [Bacteroidia bacterium]